MFNVSSIDVASTSNETVGASSSTPVLNVSDTSDQLTMFSTAYVSILSFLSDYSLHVMSAAAVVILTTFLASQIRQRYRQHRSPITETVAKKDGKFVPESVNYHMTRRCNYRCGFCFHTAKTSTELPLDEAKRGLQMLRDAGMIKVNFSGGEPFLPGSGRFLGELVKFCKQELKLESVSVVTNGSLVREKWFRKYGEYLDIMAVSCDSFDPQTNAEIGRQQNQRSDHLASLMKVRDWCGEHKVAFKINTVVNTFNKDEDMTESIQQLRPVRWKVFQCLVIDGENAGPDALRNAERFVITDEEFENFLARHSSVKQLVPESNEAMRYSYLIVDECMRFLDGGTKRPSLSILDVGVENAIDTANFDEKMFLKRGGKYTWSKADMKLDW